LCSRKPLFNHLLSQQTRSASAAPSPNKYKKKQDDKKAKAKKKGNTNFKDPNLKDVEQFALCDAMRYGMPFNGTLRKYLSDLTIQPSQLHPRI